MSEQTVYFVERIKNLINETSALTSGNREALYSVVTRSNMIAQRALPNRTTSTDISRELKSLSWDEANNRVIAILKILLEEIELSALSSAQEHASSPRVSSNSGPLQGDLKKETEVLNRVFLVHGQDEAMKQSTARTLERLGLEPVILHERPNQGRTIIEKFSDYSDVGFAVVLLSPDDIAHAAAGLPNQQNRPRARQNVIFELGFFIGKLGRKRVAALYKQATDFDLPSDYSGVLYIPYDDAGRWRFELVKELRMASFRIDANKVL